MKVFFLILSQTVQHAFRKGGGAFGTLAFYIVIATLFTFALGPELTHGHACAVMSVAMLLASITSLPMFYERDYEDGTLEQFLLLPCALELIALAKLMGQYIAIALPILIISPLVGILSGLSEKEILNALLFLLLASPTLVALGSMAAALTIGQRRGGLLQALVMLPLTVPVLIFASNGGQGALLFLAGLLFALLPISCFVSAVLIRLSQE